VNEVDEHDESIIARVDQLSVEQVDVLVQLEISVGRTIVCSADLLLFVQFELKCFQLDLVVLVGDNLEFRQFIILHRIHM